MTISRNAFRFSFPLAKVGICALVAVTHRVGTL